MLKSSKLLFLIYLKIVYSAVPRNASDLNQVKINKCCEKNEIYMSRRCTQVNKNEEWRPLFTSDKGQTNLQVNYK